MKRVLSLILVFCLILAATACAPDTSYPGTSHTGHFLGWDKVSDKTQVPASMATFKDPAPESVINTERWGNIPVNQMIVVFKDDVDNNSAAAVLKQIGGTVVGELEMINLYQLETTYTTEAELTAAIDAALLMDGVEMAFPNVEIYGTDVEGTACSPLKDPIFQDPANAAQYNIIGMENAWHILKGSGVKLNKVNVGVLDESIYTGSDEFNNKVKLTGDKTNNPAKNKNGQIIHGGLSHGGMVTNVIGADPDNNGMVGIASILEDNLNINVKNLYDNQRSSQETKKDTKDITQGVRTADGKAYTIKALAYLKKQVDDGATVINCSFCPNVQNDSNEWICKAYEKFFKKIQKTKPHVIFVAAAGNEATADKSKGALNGKNYFPAGLKVPNLVTVGAIKNDGSRADFSNFATGNAEVTLSAPGVDMLLGVDESGQPIKASGTSFSAPQVTAAIALIQSINPELNADQVKKILVESAAGGVTTGDKSVPIPEGMGSGVLRVDEAVLKTINDMRKKQNQDPYTMQELLDLNAVTLSAKGGFRDYTVTAGIPSALSGSANLKFEAQSEDYSLEGDVTQNVPAGGEASWDITLNSESAFIRVVRLDNGGCAHMTLTVQEPVVSGIYNVAETKNVDGEVTAFNYQARVEQNGTTMQITIMEGNHVLDGTYDETAKKFVGRDLSVAASWLEENDFQDGDTTVIFNTDTNPVTAKGQLSFYFPNAVFKSTVIDLTMTKTAELP